MTLEEKIKKLETLVQELESEDVDLESAIGHYGSAVKLAADVMKSLQKTEEKLTVIQKEADEITFRDAAR